MVEGQLRKLEIYTFTSEPHLFLAKHYDIAIAKGTEFKVGRVRGEEERRTR